MTILKGQNLLATSPWGARIYSEYIISSSIIRLGVGKITPGFSIGGIASTPPWQLWRWKGKPPFIQLLTNGLEIADLLPVWNE